MRLRAASFAFGIAFGFLLAWTQLAEPRVIRQMLLLQSAYAYLIMASVVGISFVVVRGIERLRLRAALTGMPIVLERARPARRHLVGSVLFGLGWSVTLACPGPIAVQIGQGFFWGTCTLAGVFIGIRAYIWNEQRHSRERVEAEAVTVST
jgi:uncharacterized membrane protein YedE/YeeE